MRNFTFIMWIIVYKSEFCNCILIRKSRHLVLQIRLHVWWPNMQNQKLSNYETLHFRLSLSKAFKATLYHIFLQVKAAAHHKDFESSDQINRFIFRAAGFQMTRCAFFFLSIKWLLLTICVLSSPYHLVLRDDADNYEPYIITATRQLCMQGRQNSRYITA